MEIGLLLLIFCIYFAPWLVALARRKTGRAKVFIVNLLFGWTVIGWLIALVMAFKSDSKTAVKQQTEPREASPARESRGPVNIKSQYISDTRERRAAVSREARKLLDEDPFIFDTETTGLDSNAEIVEICVISTERSILLDTLVRPTRSIPSAATNVHGISDRDVRDAPGWSEVYQELESLLTVDGARSKVLTAYNWDYDSRLVRQSSEAAGIRKGRLPVKTSAASPSCIMELYAIWAGDWNGYHKSYTWKRLDEAVRNFGIRFEGEAHRARADTLASLDVLVAMASYD